MTMSRILRFGVAQLFGGARRGQPVVAALGAALTIIGVVRRYGRSEKLIYRHALTDGEAINVKLVRGEAVVEDIEVGR